MVSLLSRAAASLLAHQPKPAQRSTPRRDFASAQPTSRAIFLLPPARVRVRPRQACRAAWRAHAGDAGRVAFRGPRKQARLAVFKPPQLRFSLCFSFPLPRCLSASPRTELRLRRHSHRSPAGKIGRRCSTIARNRAHIAPPRSPAPGARCRDTI